ncbi:MAG: hypothetical protein V4647_07015 [Pseudomonadota bacterium]
MRLAGLIIFPLLFVGSSARSQETLSSADRAAAFAAAGFKRVANQWQSCDAPSDSIYTPGELEQIADLNGDGHPEAINTEGSTFCYGGDEVGFPLVSRQVGSSWKLMAASPGVATLLDSTGAQGWPDIEVGGQGFCFPVLRWNEAEYAVDRFQYEGKVCRPGS